VLSDGLTISAPSTGNRAGLDIAGNGTGAGLKITGGATGIGFSVIGGGTSGDGIKVTTTSGHGINLAPVGTSMHGLLATGGNGGTSDGIKAAAGTGGVDIRGNITGNLTGTVATLTTYTGNTPQTGDAFARLGAPAGASVSADVGEHDEHHGRHDHDDDEPTNALTAGDFTAAMKTSIGTRRSGEAQSERTAAVTVGTNNDKTGYSLTQTFPANFSALAITAGGAVTAGTVSDKTGYTLTSGPLDAAGVRSAVGLASANLDTQLGTLLTSAAYTAPDNTGIAAIQTKTDKLTFTVANKLDVNVLVVNGVAVTGTGAAGSTWGPA
jgi:hypothetical protein